MRKPFDYPCDDCGIKIKNRTTNRQRLCKECRIKRQKIGWDRANRITKQLTKLRKNTKK
jgi:ribosomal protein L37AE/L43A